MRGPHELEQYIHKQTIAAALVKPAGETPTVPAAAATLGVSPDQIIKSMLFLINGEPFLVITNGEALVDTRKLAAHLGVGRKKVKLASADVVVELLDYPAGGVPPFGHKTPLPVLLDRSILDQEVVYGGGGDDRTMLRVAVTELQRATRAEVVAIT